jgi:hypothetical protein
VAAAGERHGECGQGEREARRESDHRRAGAAFFAGFFAAFFAIVFFAVAFFVAFFAVALLAGAFLAGAFLAETERRRGGGGAPSKGATCPIRLAALSSGVSVFADETHSQSA